MSTIKVAHKCIIMPCAVPHNYRLSMDPTLYDYVVLYCGVCNKGYTYLHTYISPCFFCATAGMHTYLNNNYCAKVRKWGNDLWQAYVLESMY